MHPILWKIPDFIPIIGGFPIYAYGVMLGLSFIFGWYLGAYHSNREGISYQTASTTTIVIVIFALFGARIAHVISNGLPLGENIFTALFASKCQGLVAYGGFIGGVLAAWVYLRIKKIDFWSFADCFTPSMALGLGLTRIGCFLAGCCHGQPSDLPWAVVFPEGSQAAETAVKHWHLPSNTAVHPTQLYESLLGLALLPLALFLIKRRKFTGQTFLMVACCYAIGRFLLELMRGDADRGGLGNQYVPTISTSQLIGLVLVPIFLGLFVWRWRSAPPPPQPLSKEEVQLRLKQEGVLKEKKNKHKKGKKDKK